LQNEEKELINLQSHEVIINIKKWMLISNHINTKIPHLPNEK
jgi:hypothetical protein